MINDEENIHSDDTDHRTALAKKVFRFKTDAPNQESLVRFADEMSEKYLGEGLDSLDIGDALGAFLRIAESDTQNDSGEFLWLSPQGFTVIISQDWELFQWGINLPAGTFDHIKPEDFQ